MPGKVSVTINFRWTENSSSIQGTASESVDQIGDAAIENVQFIGTASEAIVFGDVTDAGWIMFKNFDPPPEGSDGETIWLGQTSGVTSTSAVLALPAGRSAYMIPQSVTSVTWWGIASAADTRLLVIAIQR